MKQNEISAQRRQQILEATCRCLQQKPFHALTIKEIAQEANISYGLVHFYFDSKNKLLSEVINYINGYFGEALLCVIKPYMHRTLTHAEILDFFQKWMHLYIDDQYAFYNKIWYDISAQSRFASDVDFSAAHIAYDRAVAEPLGRLLAQNEDYQTVYSWMITYMEGMALRIYLYGYDPNTEVENGLRFLNLLLERIQHQ